MTPIDLILAGVGRRFTTPGGALDALKDVRLGIPWGTMTAVVGRSGCGKTTLLRLIAGLDSPTTGTIRFASRHGGELDRDHVRFGMVFQEPRLMPWLSVEGNVAFPLVGRFGRAEISRRVDGALEMTGLTDFRSAMPHQISGGMAQRVALGRALAYDPDVVLMDEPFASLDYFTRRVMQREVLRIRQRTGKTFILVTHDIDEALAMGDSVVVLRDGEVAGTFHVPHLLDDSIHAELSQIKREILMSIGEV